MLIHFFNGINYHLSYRNIESYILRHNDLNFDQQLFLIYSNGVSEQMRNDYAALFEGLVNIDYILWDGVSDLKLVLKRINNSDRVIFHSSVLSYHLKFLIYIILSFKSMLSHSILVCWNFSDAVSESTSFKSKVYNRINYIFQSRFKKICLISPEDKTRYDKYYTKNNSILLPLLLSKTIMPVPYIKQPAGRVAVMVSHSGWQHNNHEHSFRMLKNIDNDSIIVFCPLCYGDPDYIKYVISLGKSLFGDRFITELMPYGDYNNYLNTEIDIYVTSAQLQTGLGASNILLRSGAKIYVGNNLCESYKHIGVQVHSIDEFNNISYEEFIKMDDDSIYNENMKNLTIFYDSERILNEYKNILHN